MSGHGFVSGKVVLGVAVLCVILLSVTVGLLEFQNRGLQSQLESKNSAVSLLNSQLNSTSDSLTELKATVASLQSQLNSENATNQNLKSQLTNETNSANSQVSHLQTLLSFSNANEKDDKSQISSEQSTVNSLKSQVANLKSTMANWDAPVTDGFSLIQITDTQYLSDKNPELFNTLTNWIVENSNALNISMVIHTGDIVQNPLNLTNWQNANDAMMQLYNNGVPYCWDAGNHDFIGETTPAGNNNGAWLGGSGYSAFNVVAMQQEPYWVASIFNGTSTAVQFSYGNYRFMVINIAYDSNQTVLAWMQSLLKCNPNVNVIVATHNFLNGAGGYGYAVSPQDISWANNFENVVGNYSNVFMTLNGHDVGEGAAFNQKLGNREEIFFNRQEIDGEAGAASARIYTFNMTNPAQATVTAYTYQAYSNPQGGPSYLIDQINQFTFTSKMIAYSPQITNLESSTPFLGASGFSTSFSNPITLASYNQTGDLLRFYNLTLNDFTSNLTESSVGASISINTLDSSSISYTVSGGGGTQAFLVDTQPTSVNIDGTQTLIGWTYSNGVVTVTNATKAVTINFT